MQRLMDWRCAPMTNGPRDRAVRVLFGSPNLSRLPRRIISAAEITQGNPLAADINPLAGKNRAPLHAGERPSAGDGLFCQPADPKVPAQRVAFGTSGHRGSALNNASTRRISSASARRYATTGSAAALPGRCSSASTPTRWRSRRWPARWKCSRPNGVTVMIDAHDGYTPTPVISHAILTTNKGRERGLADGVVITPSHNPAGDAASNTIRPMAGRRTPTSPREIERAANGFLETASAASSASPMSARANRLRASLRLYRALCRRPSPMWSTMEAIRDYPV